MLGKVVIKMDIDVLLDSFDSVNTDLTSTNTSKITYPFLFIEDVSEIELLYLRKQLEDGEVPLMIHVDKCYAPIKNVNISLDTIKHLSRFRPGRKIYYKVSKDKILPIEEFIDLLLLEE